MKIKSVLAAIIAAAALSSTAVCAFADAADPADDQVTTTAADENGEAGDGESVVSSIPENVSEAPDPMEGNPVSGVDGAAALAGIAMVAGAALVISHKRT